MYYYVKSLISNEKDLNIKNDTMERIISLNVDIIKLYNDGSSWRINELKNLSQFITKKIHSLQNPPNCNEARFIVCNLDKGCGFGCQLHHVAYCFYMALGTNRTLLFDNDGSNWRYSKNGWNSVFLPISNCTYEKHGKGKSSASWSSVRGIRNEDVIIKIPIIDYISNKPDFVPLAIPKQLSDKMIKLHSFPTAYFTGHILSYAMRHNEQFDEEFKSYTKEVPFNETPIVGIHVRRTDKIGTEASFHDVNEYMAHAEVYFRGKEIELEREIEKRVFIATDDPSVIEDMRKKFTDYKFYGDEQVANNAGVGKRYDDSSLHGIIKDIRFLSKCSIIIGTFSSQVSRMAYELMQVESPDDAGYNYVSIDDVYYFGGQNGHNLRAIKSHKSFREGDISFKKNSLISIAGNHWNGWSKGTLVDGTREVGLFPSYKVVEDWRISDMPVFEGYN
uniref:GT23 domain-containing protein n=1 Tax=Parastrongyloides trichosuri TaxID=131310 RepID=A0A0N5A673_PARTI